MEQWISRIFDRALRCSVMTGLLAQGCSGEQAPSVVEPADLRAAGEAVAPPEGAEDGPRAVSCPEGTGFPVAARNLRPSRSFDYLAIRSVSGGPPQEGPERWTQTSFQVLSEVGAACASATTSVCREQIQKHPEPLRPTSCVQLCVEISVVTTAGDEVRRWAGSDALRSLLGSIDTADEALLLVATAGYDLSCDNAERTTVRRVSDGYVVTATKMTALCAPIITTRFTLHVSTQGVIREERHEEIERLENACVGRMPAGLASAPRDRGASVLGDFLSRGAHLEAASITAFERLATELEAHGASRDLIDEARRAADDECRHATVMGALARARGGDPVAPCIEPTPPRSLADMALENAVEGCVRETFGALVGAYQANHAGDAEIASAMHPIAADEARHAALAWKVHAWAMEQLGSEQRARIERAQVEAFSALASNVSQRAAPEIAHAAGLPGPTASARMLSVLQQELGLASTPQR
ncbi:putative lipoprotein [Minicystis rosea]|nr:putative lipoprotein [Minicystis rosea]